MAERLSEDQTTELMAKFEEIMKRCEEDGVNRDEELAERTSPLPCLCRPSPTEPINTVCFKPLLVVQGALFGAIEAGRSMNDDPATSGASGAVDEQSAPSSSKRSRTQPDR